VGRGTYARSPELELRDTSDAPINLGINSMMPMPYIDQLADQLSAAVPRGAAASIFEYQPHAGSLRSRTAGANWIARSGLETTPERVVVTAGGQHAIVATLIAVTNPGDEILVEEFTYPGATDLCERLGLRARKLRMDRHGLLPDELEAACRNGKSKALYMMPTVHNPTSAVMPEDRRREIAAVAEHYGVLVIEDDTYGFLVPDATPLSRHLPDDQSIYLTTTSKSLVPGLRVGYVRASSSLTAAISRSVLRTVVNAPPAMAELASRLITEGIADRIVEWKRKEAAARQEIAARVLGRFRYETYQTSMHLWLILPEPWLSAKFVAEAKENAVSINAAEAFSVDGETRIQAVRVCLGPPRTRAALENALTQLSRIPERTKGQETLVV